MDGIAALIRALVRRVKPLYWRITNPPPRPAPFPGTAEYWERRYASGGNSGVGSYGKFAEFKAETINSFVREHAISSVIEFGCGDGNQLRFAEYPEYLGFDISRSAIDTCRRMFAADGTKSFAPVDEYADQKADMTLSLDVIYHLVEDSLFDAYMRRLFEAARRFVVIYASNTDANSGYEGTYIRHRKFTDWIERNVPGWELFRRIPNRYVYKGDYTEGSFADFYIFSRSPGAR